MLYTAIEQLDYSVTIPSVSGLETIRYFAEHPIYGTVGYPTWDDARQDMHGILGIGQYLDSIESMINAGFVGDHYTFNAENMLVEVRNDYECWTWTPETGLVYDPEPEPATFNKPSRQERRNNKKAARRKGSPKRFRDRSRKCAHEGHIWKTYHRGLSGDCNVRGRRLEKTGRPQSVNVHFTDGATLDTFDMSEADVFQTWSADSLEYSSMDSFFEYMDNMNWGRIPDTVRFFVEWNANDPFEEDCWYSPEYFGMTATLKKGGATVTAEKAQEEYQDFKKCFQTFQKYGEKLRTLQQEMREELRA